MKRVLLMGAWIVSGVAAQENAAQEPTLTVFDVRDLLPADAEPAEVKPGEMPPPRPIDAIATFLRSFAEPPLADDEDIQGMKGGMLVARVRASRNAWIEKLLGEVRSNANEQVLFEAQILEVSREQWQLVVAPVLDQNAAVQQASVVLSDDDTTTKWCADATAASQSLQAPRILTRQLSRASLSVGETVEYRRDYEKAVQIDGTTKWVPSIDSLFDGFHVQAIGAVVADEIAISYDLAFTDLVRPIPTFRTTLSQGQSVEIDLPEITVTRFQQAVRMPAGATSVTSVPRGADGYLVILLTASGVAAGAKPFSGIDELSGTRRQR